MIKVITILVFLAFCSVDQIYSQEFIGPDIVSVNSNKLTLKGLLWCPSGNGPFPSIIFCHGSYGGSDTIHIPECQLALLGPVFARNGYIFFSLFRRGVGFSTGQGENSTDLMDKAFEERGQKGRNEVQLQQLQTDQLQDIMSGIKYMRTIVNLDTNRMTVMGHSFGGSLALLVAESDTCLKAVVVFAVAGYSWNLSPLLRTRLINAVKNIRAPIMIIHAQNDYSTTPGITLDSLMNIFNKPHLLKIYPKVGNSLSDGHNLVFQSIPTWEADVFKFLNESFRH
jgi:dienelactone hydrolase